MRKVKKYELDEMIMHSHLPEIRNERWDKGAIIALAVIAALFYAYFQFSGEADALTTKIGNIISFII